MSVPVRQEHDEIDREHRHHRHEEPLLEPVPPDVRDEDVGGGDVSERRQVPPRAQPARGRDREGSGSLWIVSAAHCLARLPALGEAYIKDVPSRGLAPGRALEAIEPEKETRGWVIPLNY